MAERGAAIPQAQTDDNEDISWALSTAEAMWSRGDLIDAIKWVRRAAEAAGDAEQDERALELAKAAAELQNQVGGVRDQPGSEPAPPPPLPAAVTAAHSAVTAPPPDGASEPPPAARASPVPPAAAITASPPRVAPSVPPPAPGASFTSGGRGPTSTAPKRPSTIPRAAGTPAPPAVARVSAPRPPLPRASGAPLPPAPPLPTGASVSPAGPPPVPAAASSATALSSTTPQYVQHLPPVAPVSAMPATARAIEAAVPAAPGSVPPAPASSGSVETRNDDPTATAHDLEPPEDTAQVEVPAAPRRMSSKAPPPPTAPRPQLDTPSTSIDGRQFAAAQTTELRVLRHPSIAEEMDAWPTQAISGEEFAESNVAALVAALPPMRPREPSKHPMDPDLLATQAVRVVVWRTPDGVRVAPAGTVVSAIACDAVLVALDPTADLSAWLTNKR
jgi:hypothetical protein